jgi:SAM-dependent methyltransferase
VNPFSLSAISHFREKVNALIQQDLGIDFNCSTTFTQYAGNLLLKEQADALPKIAQVLAQQGIKDKWNQVLWSNRSEVLGQWIAPYIVGDLLDLLCGHGSVGKLLTELGSNVVLSERESIYPKGWELPANLPYIPFFKLSRVPPKQQFDTVLLCTVLHHELNPQALLALASRLAKKRIIIVENCIESDFPADYQLLMDIFFNNCLNSTDLDSPAFHKTVEQWIDFVLTHGRVIHLERLNSLSGVPLSHQLIVIEVNQ